MRFAEFGVLHKFNPNGQKIKVVKGEMKSPKKAGRGELAGNPKSPAGNSATHPASQRVDGVEQSQENTGGYGKS